MLAAAPPATRRRDAAGAGVLQRDAGAAHHRVQAVALHERGQCAPECQHDAAVPVLAVHAGAAGLDHALAQVAQASHVELGSAVGAADAPRLGRRQHAVGADDFPACRITHQQVLAEVVEDVDVVAGKRGAQPGAHLPGEDGEPQPLCGADFVFMAGPGHFEPAGSRIRQAVAVRVSRSRMK